MPLFLDTFSADVLPYAFVGTAVVTALAGMVFRRLRERVGFASLMIGSLVLLLTVTSWPARAPSSGQSSFAVFSSLILAQLVYFVRSRVLGDRHGAA